MRRARPEADDADDDSDDEEPVPRLPRGSGSSRRSLRPWNRSKDESEEGDHAGRSRKATAVDAVTPRRPVFFRARDSIYFEPLLALCVVLVLLASLYAYTGNWPPMYVVESSSMQHGYTDQVGLLNAGDLVLAKRVNAPDGVTTYFQGMVTGYSTYGEYGDVVLYEPDGVSGTTPIIHRAILWVVYNPDGTYSIPELVGLPCGFSGNIVYQVQTNTGCLASAATQVTGTLLLFNVGWATAKVTFQLTDGGTHSGFLTMGDNNVVDGIGTPDQPSLSQFVEPAWIIGVARGMLPWFGSIKLLLTGDASYVPPQSWEYMALTLIAIVLIAFGIHYALRSAGIEDERRKREEQRRTDGRDTEDSGPERPMRAWDLDQDQAEDQDRSQRKTRRPSKTRDAPTSGRRGRPAPQTHRDSGPSRKSKKPRDDDSDDE